MYKYNKLTFKESHPLSQLPYFTVRNHVNVLNFKKKKKLKKKKGNPPNLKTKTNPTIYLIGDIPTLKLLLSIFEKQIPNGT